MKVLFIMEAKIIITNLSILFFLVCNISTAQSFKIIIETVDCLDTLSIKNELKVKCTFINQGNKDLVLNKIQEIVYTNNGYYFSNNGNLEFELDEQSKKLRLGLIFLPPEKKIKNKLTKIILKPNSIKSVILILSFRTVKINNKSSVRLKYKGLEKKYCSNEIKVDFCKLR